MNECAKHWDELKLAITTRGLGDFIRTGRENFADALRMIEAKEPDKILRLEEFDPLLVASNQISGQALHHAGLRLLAPDEKTGKPGCPLCIVAGPYATEWIEGAADNVKGMVCRLQKGPVHFDEKGVVLDPDEPLPEKPAAGD